MLYNSSAVDLPQTKAQQRIVQVGICLEKDLSARQCPSRVYSRNRACWPSQDVYYLTRW